MPVSFGMIPVIPRESVSEPFEQVDFSHCEMLAKNSSIFERELDEVLCQPARE